MLASTVRTVTLDDGAKTKLEQWGESGPVLLCVHGISSSRMSWLRTAEFFAAEYRVCAYDQRGHGDSYAVTGPMSLDQCVRDLEAVANAIGDEPFALIGHSWGGAVVLKAGRRLASQRVIAIDPMIHFAGASWAADFVEDLVPVFAVAAGAREPVIREMFGTLPPVEISAKVHAMRRMTIEPVVALGDDNEADAGKWDVRGDVRDYPKPLFLMLADPSDSVVSPEDVTFVRAEGGPNVTIEVFTGEGHTLLRTAFERYCGSAEAFLRKP